MVTNCTKRRLKLKKPTSTSTHNPALSACVEDMNGRSNCLNINGVEEVFAELTLDVVSPSDIPADADVVPIDNGESKDTSRSRPCPPYIALQAPYRLRLSTASGIAFFALTQRKKSSFLLKEAKGIMEDKDPVYKTWHYLRDQVKGIDDSNISLPSKEVENHPLFIRDSSQDGWWMCSLPPPPKKK